MSELDVAALRARLDREYAIVPGRDELPALSYRDGFALLDEVARLKVALALAWEQGYTRAVLDEVRELERADNPYETDTP